MHSLGPSWHILIPLLILPLLPSLRYFAPLKRLIPPRRPLPDLLLLPILRPPLGTQAAAVAAAAALRRSLSVSSRARCAALRASISALRRSSSSFRFLAASSASAVAAPISASAPAPHRTPEEGPSTAGGGAFSPSSDDPGSGLPSAGATGGPPNPETEAVRVGRDVRVAICPGTEVDVGEGV